MGDLTGLSGFGFHIIEIEQGLDHDVADDTKLDKRILHNKDVGWNLEDVERIAEPDAGKKA